MNIHNTQYTIDYCNNNDIPSTTIINYIKNNMNRYDHVDKTLIDLSLCKLLLPIGGDKYHQHIQDIITKLVDTIDNPIFIINFDLTDSNSLLDLPVRCFIASFTNFALIIIFYLYIFKKQKSVN